LPNDNTPPDSKAGAKERAGFIDAPEIKDKKKISNPYNEIPPRVEYRLTTKGQELVE
jgi:hypothetical protein